MYSPRKDYVAYLEILGKLGKETGTVRVGDLREALRKKGIHLDDSKGSPLSAQGANSATSACKKLYAADFMLNPPPACPDLGTGTRKIPEGEPGEGMDAPNPFKEPKAATRKEVNGKLEKTSSKAYKKRNAPKIAWMTKRDEVAKWLFESRKVEGQKKKDPPHIPLPKVVESAKSISTATALHSSLTRLSGSAGVFGYETTPTEGTTE